MPTAEYSDLDNMVAFYVSVGGLPVNITKPEAKRLFLSNCFDVKVHNDAVEFIRKAEHSVRIR